MQLNIIYNNSLFFLYLTNNDCVFFSVNLFEIFLISYSYNGGNLLKCLSVFGFICVCFLLLLVKNCMCWCLVNLVTTGKPQRKCVCVCVWFCVYVCVFIKNLFVYINITISTLVEVICM